MEVTLHENEDLDTLIDDVARLCIECHLTVINSAESVSRVLHEKMMLWERRKAAQGSKAKFRKEVFKQPQVDLSSDLNQD
jgi:hypothetical protein